VGATGRPVIVSLDFPNPNQATGRSFELHVAPASGEDSADEQADSAAAKVVRGNAAALAEAGVPFALAGTGVSSPAEFRRRILTLVEEGLSPDAALRALTVTPAEVLGLSRVLGTIEAGKVANLVVVEGDLFDEEARIAQVFVQGERYDIPRQPEGGGRGGRAGGPGGGTATAAGEWNGSMDMQGQAFAFTLTITGQNDALSATLSTEMGATTLRGDLTDGRLALDGIFESPQGQIPLSLRASVTGDEMTGTIEIEGMGTVSLTARRGGAAVQGNAIMDGGNR
jgi:hypothetical protein